MSRIDWFITFISRAVALVGGLALWALLVLWLHALLFGVAPLG